MYSRTLRALMTGLSALTLASCSNPYALNISEINYDAKQTAGVIQITDAKLYSREALINERRDEINYLKGLLEKSKTVVFSPQVVRELESITAIAGSLGLSVDPTSALNYKRDLATSSTQQEIEALKLQLQLESLKRDAVLLREQIAARTTPLSAIHSNTTGSSDISSSNTAPSTAEATKSVNDLITRLENRLKAADPLARTNSTAKIDPSDLFLDRAAYRHLIKSTMSAERLDELHDKNGNALMRFHFGATVLPPKSENMDTLGILRMEVQRPELKKEDYYAIYRLWLNYVNDNFNIPVRPQMSQIVLEPKQNGPLTDIDDLFPNPRFLFLSMDRSLFDILSIEVPRTKEDEDKCLGIFGPTDNVDPSCLNIYLAIPLNSDSNSSKDSYQATLSNALRQSQIIIGKFNEAINEAINEAVNEGKVTSKTDAITLSDSALKTDLRPLSEKDKKCTSTSSETPISLINTARHLLKTEFAFHQNYQAILENKATRHLTNYQKKYIRNQYTKTLPVYTTARLFLNTVFNDSSECRSENVIKKITPAKFEESIKAIIKKTNTRIYSVFPRERAQQISTVTRAAEAVSFAAAIAGNLPKSGIGIDAQSAFSRSVSGKADARERAPLVISFAEPAFLDQSNTYSHKTDYEKNSNNVADVDIKSTKPVKTPPAIVMDDDSTTILKTDNIAERRNKTNAAFGWLLGPRVIVNPTEKKLELRHHTAPYELTVDLSLAGWLPYVNFKIQTAWAPNWRTENGTTLKINFDEENKEKKLLSRVVRVPLAPNNADMSSLTSAMILQDSSTAISLTPAITDISPSEVSACAETTTLRIQGNNIWRSKKIIVGGQEFTGEMVRVTPDMGSVLVNVDTRALPQAKTHVFGSGNANIDVYALNEDGEAHHRIALRHLKEDGTCDKPAKSSKPSKKPEIENVNIDTMSICDTSPSFTISGKNLTEIVEARLGMLPATSIINADKGVTITPTTPENIKAKLAGFDKAALFVRTKEGSAQIDITIKNPAQCH
jgi:hypothetical protein